MMDVNEALEIVRILDFDASPTRVWSAITDPQELSQWFPDRAELELVPGSRGSFTWENHGTFPVDVLEVDPPKRLVWRWPGNDERTIDEYSTKVEWELTAREDGGTTLRVRETGFDSEKHHGENTSGWTHELGELVEYLAA